MASFERLKERAKEHLEPQEEIITSVKGVYETKIFGQDSVREGVFLATNKRVIKFAKKLTGYDLEVFPYSTISSIEMSKGFLGHKIAFFASGNKASMKWIQEGNVHEFINEVKSRIGKKEEIATKSDKDLDIPDQIKKLAELKEQGILTEEEFETKKKELLTRL